MIPRTFGWDSKKIGLAAALTRKGNFDSHGRPLRLTQAVNQGTITTSYFAPWRRSDSTAPYNAANLADQYREYLQSAPALSVLTWVQSVSANSTTLRNYISCDDHGATDTGFVLRWDSNTTNMQWVTQQGGGNFANELRIGVNPTDKPSTSGAEHILVATVDKFTTGYVGSLYLNQRFPVGTAIGSGSTAASTSANYFTSTNLPIQFAISNPTGATVGRRSRSFMYHAELWARHLPSTQALGRVWNPLGIWK